MQAVSDQAWCLKAVQPMNKFTHACILATLLVHCAFMTVDNIYQQHNRHIIAQTECQCSPNA